MKIKYFAWIRERVGTPEEELTPPPGLRTVADLTRWLAARDEAHAHALENPALVRIALDQQHVRPDALIGEAREIAFFPPMTGG